MRRLVLWGSVFLLAMPGCRRSAPAHPTATVNDEPRAALRMSALGDKDKGDKTARAGTEAAEPRPLQRCFAGDGPGLLRPLSALLDRAADRFDAEDFAAALACAEEAARLEARSIEAHHGRASALLELGRTEEAQAAFARALALDPDDPETLAGAADLYINHLTASNDHTETGLEYARRGARRVKRRDRKLAARLALLAGQALNDLGRSREALSSLDAALAADAEDLRVRYERGVALFELCRFAEARQSFGEVLRRNPEDAWAHYQLGLVLERLGDDAGGARELGRAQQLVPDQFTRPVLLSPAEFRAMVEEEALALPAALRADLALADLETADLPDVADLTAEEPPLSPTILGLFRGVPLGEAQAGLSEQRTIILYRKNLGRAVRTREELAAQVRTTLLHELGHLRGEDDQELRARGLE